GGTWIEIPTPHQPHVSICGEGAFIRDSNHQRIVFVPHGTTSCGTGLLPGVGPPSVMRNDLWVYDGSDWSSLTPAARVGSSYCYDTTRDRVVLFGGDSVLFGFIDDTWEYVDHRWTQVQPSVSPPARRYHAMCFDLRRQRAVLFGGEGGTGVLGDTWTYDGVQWSGSTMTGSPPARQQHAMCYDPVRDRVVLFGGIDTLGIPLGDTWELRNAQWLQVPAPSTSPTARSGHAMTFDSARGTSVLFGGLDASGLLADTWTFDGASWLAVATSTSPTPRQRHNMVFDCQRGRTLLAGGNTGNVPGPLEA